MNNHIGLMGAHSTGKTTYAHKFFWWVIDAWPDSNPTIVSEVARKCPYPVNRETSELGQMWIFHSQLVSEINALRSHDWVICDRTILDNLAYSEAAGLSDIVDALMPQALAWLERYTSIYWFRPVEGWLMEDGFRDVDPEYQRRIDSILSEWIDAYHIPVHRVQPDGEFPPHPCIDGLQPNIQNA